MLSAMAEGPISTAILISMYHRGISTDLILFADTGGEQHTYALKMSLTYIA